MGVKTKRTYLSIGNAKALKLQLRWNEGHVTSASFSLQVQVSYGGWLALLLVLWVVLQAADEICDRVSVKANLVNRIEQREPGEYKRRMLTISCSLGGIFYPLIPVAP
jgi:hypothetical protein